MNPSPPMAARRHHLRQSGLVLVLIMFLAFLALIVVVGAGMSHIHQGRTPTVKFMVPVTSGNDSGPSSIAGSHGDLPRGGVVASNGEILIGTT